jgi:16S rRNA (guanine966-N2)-methyltransferase
MGRNKKQKSKNPGEQPGRLRIVAGKWRSRLLPIADVEGLRPTSERIRETLFNWLAPALAGAKCLDLFAGSGALGLEALSRGAQSVLFVERSAVAVTALRECLEVLDAQHASILNTDAEAYLNGPAIESFDLVFLDPPFAADLAQDLCRLLAGGGWLAPGANVYLEQDRDQARPDLPDGWRILKEKTTGNVRYSLMRAE